LQGHFAFLRNGTCTFVAAGNVCHYDAAG